MATSILQIPSLYTPAFNPMFALISGSHSVSGDYELVVDVKNASGDILSRQKNPTDPVYQNEAAFDVHRIIENYVSQTVSLSIDRVTQAPQNIFPYILDTWEQQGDPPALFAGAESAKQYALNIALSPKEFLSWNYLSYLQGSTTRQFLNKYKGIRKVFTITKAFLYFLQDDNFPITDILIDPYDSDGNALGTSVIRQIFAGSSDYERTLYIPSGPTNLNLIPSGELLSGTSGSVIPAGTSYYDVYLRWSGGAVVGEAIRYSIVDAGCKYVNYPVYFLGQYGNFEIWNFDRRSDLKSIIERKNYRASLGRFLSPVSYGYTNNDRQETQYNTTVQDGLILNTDLLTEAEYGFLKELVQSPCVFVLQDGELIPVVLTDTDYDKKQKVNQKLFNLTINVRYATVTELQRY